MRIMLPFNWVKVQSTEYSQVFYSSVRLKERYEGRRNTHRKRERERAVGRYAVTMKGT